MKISSWTARLAAAGILCSAAAFAHSAPVAQAQYVRSAYLPSLDAKAQESRNRDLVTRLYFRVFNGRDTRFATQLINENLIQHDPTLGTGRQPLLDALQALFTQSPQASWTISHIIAEGDLVALQVLQKNSPQELGTEFMEIYRVKDGQIIEHWNTQTPVSATPANSNTQF